MDFDKFDQQIGEVLATVPSTRESQDTIMAIEGEMHDLLAEDARMGWITPTELETILSAFHKRLNPETP